MKFRNKMVLAYTTVALLSSLLLGVIVARQAVSNEIENQKNNLRVAARSYVGQMDEIMGRMDAIMHYILSDETLLQNITLLSHEKTGNVPERELLTAKTQIGIGLSTDYTMKNSYRTVFFNQNSFFASNVIRAGADEYTSVQRVISDFSYENMSYLDAADEANGKSVIVPEHIDYWGVSRRIPVFSLMKRIRGEDMGYLEIEQRMDILAELEQSDPQIGYLILVNGTELLYASDESYPDIFYSDSMEKLVMMQEDRILTRGSDIYVKLSSDEYDLSVLAYKKDYLMSDRQRFFLLAFLLALVTFGVSLIMILFWSDVLTRPVKRMQEIVENTNIENLRENPKLEEADALNGSIDEFQKLIHAYQAMTVRLDRAVQDEKRATTLQLQAQFNMLQAQVNPHFIYNVLNTISSRAILMKDEMICQICDAFGNMLRYSTSSRERYATVGQELEYLDNYFYLLKVRHGEQLQVNITVDDATKEQIIPKMTLQQLVENCVKYGQSPVDGSIRISVTGCMKPEQWFVQIQDCGAGITEQKLDALRQRLNEVCRNIQKREMAAELEIGGMGIVNTFARCRMLYAEELIFDMHNVQDGSGFIITVGKNRHNDGGKTE